MKVFYATLSLLVAGLLIFTLPALSQQGSLGITYTAGGGNTDIGLIVDHKTHTPLGELQLNGNLAYGQGVDATADASLTLPVYRSLGLRPYAAFVGKGTEFSNTGGNLDGGLAINFKIGNVDVGGGAFGRASAEFAPTKRDELLSAGVDGVTPDMLDTPALNAAATDGLPILKPDTPLHITLYAEWDLGRFHLKGRWMGEASFDEPIQQYRLDADTSYDLGPVNAGIHGSFIAQTHQGTFDGEYNLSATLTHRWGG